MQTETQMIDELTRLADRYTRQGLAKQMGISAPYLTDLLKGRRAINDRIAAMLGYRRIVLFEKIENDSEEQSA